MFVQNVLIILCFQFFGKSAFGDNETDPHLREERSAITFVWDDALIPYEFKSDFPAKDREMFIRATKYISDRTCVRFREKQAPDRFWLIVVLGGCCGSWGGRWRTSEGKGQEITFSSGLILPFYLHELGHALGFPHEQDRMDRDDYIYWDKNKKDCHGDNFGGKAGNLDQAALDIRFDYVSLMADWTECYWAKPPMPKDIPLGGGSSDDRTYSMLDIEKINAIYDCGGCYGYRFRKIEQLSAYQDPYPAGYELDRNIFYVCRIYHEGHLLLGKSLPDDNKCWIGYNGAEIEYKEKFDVLTNPGGRANLRWIRRPDNFAIPKNTIKGGRTKDRENIYVGRCLRPVGDRQTLIPGYFLESNPRELRIPFGGGMQTCSEFDILVCG